MVELRASRTNMVSHPARYFGWPRIYLLAINLKPRQDPLMWKRPHGAYSSTSHHKFKTPTYPEKSKPHQHHHRPLPMAPAWPPSFANLASSINIFKSRDPNPSRTVGCGNVSGSYNNTWNHCNIRVTDERRHLLEWLSPLAPRLRHRDVRRSQAEGVGDWLLSTEEFINWSTGADGVVNPVLFCYGDPGVGKTHIRYHMSQNSLGQMGVTKK